MPFTANKAYGVPAVGSDSGTWGSGAADALNETVMGFLDLDLGGLNSTALSSSNVTLTSTQGRNLIQRLTGTLLANVTITTPNVGFNYFENATTGSFTVTLQFTGAVGGTVVLPQGFAIPVFIDATNGVRVATGVTGGAVTRYGLYDALSIHGADVASNATVNLETATGYLVDITGTTTITAVTLSEGHQRLVRFTGILTLTNGASLVLPGAANIVTAAGDYAVFVGYSGGIVRCADYQRAAQAPNAAASDSGAGPIEIAIQSEMEAASSVLLAVTPGRQHFHPGHPKAGGNFDGTGTPTFRSGDVGMGAITDNGSGNYTLALDTAFADTNYWMVGNCRRQSGAGNSMFVDFPDGGTKTASAFQITLTAKVAGGPTFVDSTEVAVMFWGDYA